MWQLRKTIRERVNQDNSPNFSREQSGDNAASFSSAFGLRLTNSTCRIEPEVY